jgi:hypothetical protein
MPVFDLYSRRRKRAAGEVPDVYTYDKIPEALRVQIVHIWGDALGNPERIREFDNVCDTYQQIVETLRRAYGVFVLSSATDNPNDKRYAYQELRSFFLDTGGFKNISALDKALDIIELTFKLIDRVTRRPEYLLRFDADEIADNAIEELNARFREHGVGYYFADGVIIRADSELVHAETVKPALAILRQREFATAQSEFLAAHEHYRHGKYPEALVEACKAFESTMKIICTKRKWQFDKARGALELVQVCLDNGLIPAYWQSHFAGLRSVLSSAILTPRNKQAGHGAGSDPIHKPPDELVAYVLHMTAATILFLTEADRHLA